MFVVFVCLIRDVLRLSMPVPPGQYTYEIIYETGALSRFFYKYMQTKAFILIELITNSYRADLPVYTSHDCVEEGVGRQHPETHRGSEVTLFVRCYPR